jgi:hypothetical protein
MTPETKSKIQIILAIAIAVAALRTGWILYNRHSDKKQEQEQKQAPAPLNADYYVTPKRLHAYDLKSARELTRMPTWVKEGYRYTYYPYDPARRHADFEHEAGLLPPLQKLEIRDVVLDTSPKSKSEREVMAVFQKEGKSYAFPIGIESGGDYRIYSDEMLFIQDPKELYKHWPSEVWDSIDKHEIKSGMNELQADFAIGMGVPERSDDPNLKTVNYPNGGKPLTVIYRDGKAAEIKPGA